MKLRRSCPDAATHWVAAVFQHVRRGQERVPEGIDCCRAVWFREDGRDLTLAPQFLSAEQVSVGPLLILATVHVLTMATWLGIWSVLLVRSRRVTRTDRFKNAMNRAGGTILIVLGIGTVTT